MNDTIQPNTAPSGIIGALVKNRDATEEVNKVADDLLVVRTVLKEEISEGAKTDVVDRAVEQAGELEKRLTQSTELLDEVNDTLEQAAQGVDSGSEGSADLSAPRKHAPHFLLEKDGGLN